MWCLLLHCMLLHWQCGVLAVCSGPFVQSTGVTSSCDETSSFCWGWGRWKIEQAGECRHVCGGCGCVWGREEGRGDSACMYVYLPVYALCTLRTLIHSNNTRMFWTAAKSAVGNGKKGAAGHCKNEPILPAPVPPSLLWSRFKSNKTCETQM